ncbi:hypothetical protein Ping_0479 [Psychromonas ingrahamii 37]|uniref:Uncharacterized protein n=1 Tax=Psychromonas ingrahamii (strain DSM 17664 / CCUG 51855 / 37) TaxID=357804 RepID=A1SS71_PSYIN|nr:hypothetical protein [Psychromonas ingrahamii]ABM02336.1 hypothetical protein Ping_0479 [Psychromonas ingrahamii 37]
MKKGQQGFRLTALLIIRAALALLSYKTYTAKVRFSEVVFATSAIKSAAKICRVQKVSAGLCGGLSDADSESDTYGELKSLALIVTGTTFVITALATTLKILTGIQRQVKMVTLLLLRMVFVPLPLFVNT